MEALIQSNSNLDHSDDSGDTALHFAANQGKIHRLKAIQKSFAFFDQ